MVTDLRKLKRNVATILELKNVYNVLYESIFTDYSLIIIYYLFLGEDSNMSIRTRKTRSQVEEGTNDTWNWEEVLKKNPDACRAAANTEEEEERNARAEKQAKHIKKIQMQILENPTLEMCRIMARLKELEDERRAWLQKDQLQEFNKQRKAELQARFAAMDLEPVQNTPAMDEVSFLRKILLAKSKYGVFRVGPDIFLAGYRISG